jgi:hypothetical protein
MEHVAAPSGSFVRPLRIVSEVRSDQFYRTQTRTIPGKTRAAGKECTMNPRLGYMAFACLLGLAVPLSGCGAATGTMPSASIYSPSLQRAPGEGPITFKDAQLYGNEATPHTTSNKPPLGLRLKRRLNLIARGIPEL